MHQRANPEGKPEILLPGAPALQVFRGDTLGLSQVAVTSAVQGYASFPASTHTHTHPAGQGSDSFPRDWATGFWRLTLARGTVRRA